MKYTNIGLVQHANKALAEKWEYVNGTIGKILTRAIINDLLQRYPEQTKKYLDTIETFIGERTTDCINLIKSYLWWNPKKNDPDYDVKYDCYEGTWMTPDAAFSKAIEKGVISTLPELPGIVVYYKGHAGVYIGNGEVIEARGTKYGVVKTKLKERGWTHWYKYPGIEYEDGIETYKKIIQEHVGFSNPEGVWKYVDMHPYAAAWYQQWANSYKYNSGYFC